MTNPFPDSGPLTPIDRDVCLRIIQQGCPTWQSYVDRAERAGFSVDEIKQKIDANRQQAVLFLREFFPGSVPRDPTVSP